MSSKSKNLSAVVLAAGKSVRMCSRLPKVLHKVCGQSILERIIRSVAALGCTEVVVVVGFERELVTAELKRLESSGALPGISLKTVVQEQQLGTGHATSVALAALNKQNADILILPGDIALISAETLKVAEASYRSSEAAVMLLSTELENPAGFGRVVRDAKGRVQKIVELKDCTEKERLIKEINSSVYFVERDFLETSLQKLTTDNAQGELYLTDIVHQAVQISAGAATFVVQRSAELIGANSQAELCELEQIRREELLKELMITGVRVEDAASLYIDEGVRVGADSYLGAGTRLYGRTTLGEGVNVEGNCLIRDSEIASGSTIKFSCHIENARIGARTSVGPFARIRPGSVLGDEVRVGNFVELKKAELKRGVKAGHLSYLGDTVIGEESNIGAGTITCNYDGAAKHQTVIGKDVFIGSNSCLIAPVQIGDGAYIGGGSTINKDVPAGALGLGRAQQVVKAEWASRRKTRQK